MRLSLRTWLCVAEVVIANSNDFLSDTVIESDGANAFEYNETIARTFGYLAETAYCGPMHYMTDWTCEPCQRSGVSVVEGSWRYVHHQEGITPNATYVMVARLTGPAPLNSGCLVSARGTEMLANVMPDTLIERVSLPAEWNCPGCSVCDGWYRTWVDVEQRIVDMLSDIGCPPGNDTSLFLTGHSMGAAVSTLATYSLRQKFGYNIGMSISFASPRVGNAAFATAFNSIADGNFPFFRVTHSRDPIVHLPPAFLGFQHVGHEVFYEESGAQPVICDGLDDPHCASRMNLFDIKDHCGSPFVKQESLCACPGWVATTELNV